MPAPKYQPATWSEARAVHGPKPGTQALLDTILWHMRLRGLNVWSGGIYNRRTIRGSVLPSLHSCGRALDVMVPQTPAGRAAGDQLFLRAINAAEACGICEIIWNRQRWTADRGVRPYKGTNPHLDHVHIGQTIDVASRGAGAERDNLVRWYAHFLFNV